MGSILGPLVLENSHIAKTVDAQKVEVPKDNQKQHPPNYPLRWFRYHVIATIRPRKDKTRRQPRRFMDSIASDRETTLRLKDAVKELQGLLFWLFKAGFKVSSGTA